MKPLKKCICVFFTVEAKNNECSSSSMHWSRRNDEMCFEQAYTHVRQFVNKNGLHKIVFFSFFFPSLQLYIYIYIHACTVLLSHSHLVLKMLTNAIIKWGGDLGEGRTRTLNWTREERKVKRERETTARAWKNKRSNRRNYDEE